MNWKHNRFVLASIILIQLVVSATLVHAQQVDLTPWTAESYPAISCCGPAIWTVAPDGLSVYQSVNGQPTIFYSDFNAFNTSFRGKVVVETADDDDYFGFALGFQPGDTANLNADYLLIDWKMMDQDGDSDTCTPGGPFLAPVGLAVSRVIGIPTADEFWGHENFDTPECSDLNNGLIELQRGITLGDTGWSESVEYEFQFDFTPTSLRVFVNGTLELDIMGSFSDGRIAFYNFSQACVRYSGTCPIDLDATASTNLIVNGDAENGRGAVDVVMVVEVPDWKTTSNFTAVQYGTPSGFPDEGSPGPPDRGENFLAGGPMNKESTAIQIADVSASAVRIDTGLAPFCLSGYLGGFLTDDDHAVLTATFLDGSGAALDAAMIGPVSAADRGSVTGLLLRSTSGFVPAGTREVELMLVMTGSSAGAYNCGYADNLRLLILDCPADLDGDGSVGFADLTQLLAAWGPCAGCPEDIDGDGSVGFDDLTTLLAAWGPCP